MKAHRNQHAHVTSSRMNDADVIPLNISVEEALKVVISCGLVHPNSSKL